jgi:hypothetical protein
MPAIINGIRAETSGQLIPFLPSFRNRVIRIIVHPELKTITLAGLGQQVNYVLQVILFGAF